MPSVRVQVALIAAVVSLSAPLHAQAPGLDGAASGRQRADLLVSTDWLAEHLNDDAVVVLHTGGDRSEYEAAHIPGARFVPHEALLRNGHMLASPERLAELLSNAGAADDRRIVIYGEYLMVTAHLFVALDSLGHDDHTAILDGGFDAWRAEGRPVSTNSPPPRRGKLTPRPRNDVLVEARWVRSRLERRGVRILDVRSESEYRSGHLPSARLVEWEDLLTSEDPPFFKDAAGLRAALRQAGVRDSDMIVSYCAVGMRASIAYFVARYLGLPARVYLGSYSDWSQRSGYPVVR